MFFQPINDIRRTVLFYSSIFIILFFTLQGCSKKEHIKLVDSTPISVEIGGYKNLKKNEVTFTGKLTYLNDEKVVDFGWVIKDLYPDESHKETTNETIVSMGNTPKVGTLEYVYKPKSAFELGKHYSYYMYLKTEENFYISESNTFLFDGLFIKTEEILKAAYGDYVIIEGDFSMINKDYQLQLGDLKTNNIPYKLEQDKTILRFQFPPNPENIYSGDELNITLSKIDKSKIYSANIGKLRVLAKAEITNKESYKLVEAIQFTPIGFSPANPRNGHLELIVGDNIINFSDQVYLWQLDKLSPNMRVGYINDRDTIFFQDVIRIQLPDPKLFNFSKLAVHPHSDFTLTGINLDMYFLNLQPSALLGEKYQISFQNNNFVIPNIPDGSYDLTLKYPIGTLKSHKSIEVRTLKWSSFSSINPHYGDTVTIKGNFIKGQEYRIYTPNYQEQAVVVAVEENQIQAEISTRLFSSGEWKIGYRDHDYNYTYVDKSQFVTIKPSILTSASPLRGKIGQVITLKGPGISYAEQVLLGDTNLYSTEINNNEIQITVPSYIPNGKMRLSIVSNGQISTLSELFEIY